MTPKPGASNPRRILLIQLRRLGDVVLSAGLLEDLHRELPAARVDMLVGPAAAPVLEAHPLLPAPILYDASHPFAMARLLRGNRYDWVIDAQSNPRTAMLTRYSGAAVRVGWKIGPWEWVYTHRLSRDGFEPAYVLRERQRMLELLGVSVGPPRTRLVVTDAERSAGERLLREAGAEPGKPRVALVTAGADPTREWPIGRFAELASALVRQACPPVVLHNPGDDARVDAVRASAPGVAVVRTHPLRHLMAVLAACDVLVSADTGPAHIADALGVPRVTIYGPTNPANWNPGRPTTRIVRDPVRTARREGITGVAVSSVLDEVIDLLRANRRGASG